MALAHGLKRIGVLGTSIFLQSLSARPDAAVGAGQMGLGIAYVSAVHAKVPVLLYDKSKDQVAKGLALMDKLLAKGVHKGVLDSSDAQDARERVAIVDSVAALRDADMTVEVRLLGGYVPLRWADAPSRRSLRISR